MSQVARLYRFRGRHHVPSLPFPWCEPHEHDYTVEVVARGGLPVVVSTDLIDVAWREYGFLPSPPTHDLSDAFGAENTTVETLANHWLTLLAADIPEVSRVTVWEDDTRWGSAER